MIDAQRELDDEILSACHDGELPATEAESVKRRLMREPELAERLHAMQRVDEALVGAFHSIDRRAIPARILDLLQADEDEQGDGHGPIGDGAVPLSARRTRLLRWPVVMAERLARAMSSLRGR